MVIGARTGMLLFIIVFVSVAFACGGLVACMKMKMEAKRREYYRKLEEDRDARFR